ncbi:MAG: hypothetical protein ACK5PQ_04955 [Alphaproteobacteria bacterium]
MHHFKHILNPLANIYANGWGWVPVKGDKLDEEEAKKNPDFFSCVERISFNGIVANSSSCTGSLSADDESFMSQVINFLALDISKGKEGNDIDVVLLRLNRPFLPLTNLPFQTTSHEPKKTIYGIGTKSSWNFANGERSRDGCINIHSKKPLSPLSSPEKGGTFFSFKGEEEDLFIHHLFTQTVTPLPQRPLAVGLFEGFKEEDDETFKPQESLIYHNISPEDMPLFGLFTGGTSGGPVFALNEKKEFYLYGLIRGTKSLMIDDTQFYVNIVQTFPEELVKRINQIIFGE